MGGMVVDCCGREGRVGGVGEGGRAGTERIGGGDGEGGREREGEKAVDVGGVS